MTTAEEWKAFWKKKGEESNSHFEYDRGRSPREREIERLSNEELLEFIEPKPNEIVFDAGCGTGSNLVLLYSKVRQIIGMDYTAAAVERCRNRVLASELGPIELIQGDITDIPIPDALADKVLCMSVFQYLDDAQVFRALAEFRRILSDGGIVIMHIKNSSSLYLSTLWAAKRIKAWFWRPTRIEYLRPFRWYVRTLRVFGFEIVDYNSFNFFMIEGMPKGLLSFLQKLELRHRCNRFFRSAFVRQHGSDLKLKAQYRVSSQMREHGCQKAADRTQRPIGDALKCSPKEETS